MASCKSVASFCSGETEVNHEGRESEQAHLITVGGGGRIRCDDGDNTNANVINNNNNNNISHFNMSDPPANLLLFVGSFAAPLLVFCVRLLHIVGSADAAEKFAASVG